MDFLATSFVVDMSDVAMQPILLPIAANDMNNWKRLFLEKKSYSNCYKRATNKVTESIS